MKLAIKYCGGCNPDYDRVATAERIEERLNGRVEFVSAEDEDIDLVLAVEGCKTACADLRAFKNAKIRFITTINKQKTGAFTTDDLELLNLAARMVAVAINNSRRYDEISVANEARRKFIKQITGNIGNIFN